MSATTLQPPTQPPAQRFAAILEALRRAVAARSSPKGLLAVPLAIFLWRRLGRLMRRFASLAARVDAGTLAPPRRRAPRPRRAPSAPAPRLPRSFAWLCRPVPEANVLRSQLQHLFGQEDMASLLAAPQMGRILRPLCHMLGLRPPASLRLPPARRRKLSPATATAAPPPAAPSGPPPAAPSGPPPAAPSGPPPAAPPRPGAPEPPPRTAPRAPPLGAGGPGTPVPVELSAAH